MRRLSFLWHYLFKPPWDSGIPAPELVRALAGKPAGNALDLGCGTGTNVLYLAERGWQVTGIDYVPTAIARAKRKLGARPARLLVGDVTRLKSMDLDGPFDLALDMGCLHSLTQDGRVAYAAGLAHWMRPGGQYLLYAWQRTPDQPGGLSREDMEALFGKQFAVTGYEEGQGRPSAWHYLERLP